jgi:pre-rRNA-processing protein TSR4
MRFSKSAIVTSTPTEQPVLAPQPQKKPSTNLGEALFGVKVQSTGSVSNPFATTRLTSTANTNPFSASETRTSDPVPFINDDLTETFAQKARISADPPQRKSETKPSIPWPDVADFHQPYPAYHLDADKEYLGAETQDVPANARLDSASAEGSSSAADEKAAFESSMDKTFQRFADRLGQNPEQILRYEIGGWPLLYSKKDAVGRLFDAGDSQTKVSMSLSSNGSLARVPRCSNCNAGRLFELQLTPHAITELETNEMDVDGMDWGTIILAVCDADCPRVGVPDGCVSYLEEWVGVQWEELIGK